MSRKEFRFHRWINSSIEQISLRSACLIGLVFLIAGCEPAEINYLALQSTVAPGRTQTSPVEVQPILPPQAPPQTLDSTATPTPKPATRLFEHPEGIFEISLPETWSINSEGDFTNIKDSSSGVRIDIQIINTGYELDPESLAHMVDARETNLFGAFENYLETNLESNAEEGAYTVEKRLSEGGEPKIILTQYHQIGPSVLVLDLWSDQVYYVANETDLNNIVSSLSVSEVDGESEAGRGNNLLTAYSNGSFSMQVPGFWRYQNTATDHSVVDTFTSPDGNAVIQMIVYDDSEYISGSVAGAFVRNLIRNYYAKDIVVTSYKYLADGREELIWNSAGSNYEGITYFDARDTELIIYTVMSASDYRETYSELLNNALNSFQSIQSE